MFYKLLSYFWIFITIIANCNLIAASSSSPTSLGSEIDIDTGPIPPFHISEDLTISSEFLKFCRLSMLTIPMDPKAYDLELNQGIPIPIIAGETIASSADVVHPLQIQKNRILARSYIAGRNIVITSGKSQIEHLVFITGMGPKYGETEKVKLQEAIGAEVFDIIDVLPELSPDLKQEMRYIFINTKYLLELEKLLLQSSISEENADDIKFIFENISPQIQLLFKPLKEFIDPINFEEITSIPSTEFIGHKKVLEEFLEKQKITTKQACYDLLNGLLKIVSSHLGSTQRQKDVAVDALSNMIKILSTNESYYRDFIMQITSLEPMVLSSSLAGLKLVDDEDKNHERALGDLFHSEPLYTTWKTDNPSSAQYFFTQRDMCAVCDPHVCQYFKDKDSVPFFIISAREGNTPGQKSVDQVFSLSDGKWELIGAPLNGSKIHYEAQGTKVQRFLLPDLYSNKVVLQTQQDKLLAKLEFVITNFNDTPKTLISLKRIIIEGKNLDIPRKQLKGVIASLETKNHKVWTELLTIIEQ